jgi:hypothetical protein
MFESHEERQDGLQRFEWHCPRQQCRYHISSWSEKGVFDAKKRHLNEHFRQDTEFISASLAEARERFANMAPKRPEDYQTMKLTWLDITFLKTRGIAIDDDMEYYDGKGRKFEFSKV